MTVHTSRVGVAARVGHDLVLDVQRWTATLELVPAGESRLTASIDSNSLRAREGHGGVKPLTDSDRADINKTIVEKILLCSRNPEIGFQSDPFGVTDERTWEVPGRLTLRGATMPVQIRVTVDSDAERIALDASAQITQSSFGIKPHTAMLGALKVADQVEVRVRASVPAGDWPS
jgi:polyisoprenoid-binding protein YceI